MKDWAEGQGIAGDINEICAHPDACKMVCDDLNAEGKKANLGANEKLAAVHLISGAGAPDEKGLDSPWTPENNFLTWFRQHSQSNSETSQSQLPSMTFFRACSKSLIS